MLRVVEASVLDLHAFEPIQHTGCDYMFNASAQVPNEHIALLYRFERRNEEASSTLADAANHVVHRAFPRSSTLTPST